MRPGDQIQFVLIDSASAKSLNGRYDDWLRGVLEGSASTRWSPASTVETSIQPVEQYESSMLVRDDVTIRQAGDEFIIFEVGEMCLDISSRVKVELWEREMRRKNIDGVIYFNTCIRSSLVHFDPTRISLDALAKIMLDTADALGPVEEVEMPVTIHRLPAVPDDPWTREAIEYYMKTARKEAVYLPSNCDYIARNNGLGENAVTDALFKTPWLVLARGFFVMLPFIIVSRGLKRLSLTRSHWTQDTECWHKSTIHRVSRRQRELSVWLESLGRESSLPFQNNSLTM